MESEWRVLPPNPAEKANPLSKLLFCWTLPIFRKGYKKNLEIDDIYITLKKDKSEKLGDILEEYYLDDANKCHAYNKKNENVDKSKIRQPSLAKALAKTFWKELLFYAILIIFNELIVRLSTPVVLGKLLEYFHRDTNVTHQEALYYAGGIVVLSGLNVVAMNHYMLGCFHMGMRARVAVCSLIYRKSLKLSQTALGESAPGKVVNLLSNDVNRFDLVSVLLHYLWVAPLLAVLVLYFLLIKVGLSGVLGVAVVFTVMPIQAYTGKLSSKFRLQTAMKTDERVRLMGEIISGIQVIKMYAWEKPFQALITIARKLEIKVIRKTSYVRAVYMTFLMTTTRVAVFFCLLMMYYWGEQITAAKVFVIATYFNLLSSTMSAMFVRAIAEIAEFLVALKRLQSYLQQEEFVNTKPTNSLSLNLLYNGGLNNENIKTNGNEIKKEKRNEVNYSVKLTRATCKWLPDTKNLTLDIEKMEIKTGKLIGIIGPIGCGKSSLLQMVLGELPLVSGNLEVNGVVSYACQEPWVFGGTVRQNILFGLEYEKHRYKKVITACALIRDIEQFPAGDLTLIGERGTSLSGGQKARINLARAVYRNADVYLMDDPLSAVDAHVGRHLFESCIQQQLAGKTRMLVTHQLHYLREADHIILLKDGRIEMQGTYSELINSTFEFTTMLSPLQEDPKEGEDDIQEFSRGRIRTLSRLTNKRKDSIVSHNTNRSLSITSSIVDLADLSALEPDEEEIEEKPQTIAAEASSKKAVIGSVAFGYLKAGINNFFLFILFSVFALSQFMASAADYWMSFWTSQEELREFHSKDSNDDTTTVLPFVVDNSFFNETEFIDTTPSYISVLNSLNYTEDASSVDNENLMTSEMCILIYCIIIVLLLFITFIRSISFYNVCMRASQKLHDLMFRGIVRSPLRFFHINPSGRIMNRFSKDMGSVDEVLPKAILDSSQVILQIVGAVVLSCYVNPIFLVPIAIVMVLFALIRHAYLKSSKNIKRLEGICRSPVFTHLNATLQGLSTIRAFGMQTILKTEFDNHQNIHTSVHYLFIATSSAFGLLLDFFCLLLVGLITFSFLLVSSEMLGDKVGLAITQVMSLTFMMQWGIRQSAEVSNQLMAVERVLEYTQLSRENGIAPDDLDNVSKNKLKQNQPKEKAFKNPPRDWPERANIIIQDLYMKYSEDKDDAYVLNGLNCTFKDAEKIGIVGRTGAGKSSIISAMFRLAYNEGTIIIDGVNTEDICLEDLRKKISIIPQDPVLFSGTLRRNLDPFEEYSDNALWNALSEVELKDAIDGPGGLESRVMDGGANFSVGQRQLICLARAILRDNRILMLDEATANVDPYTDNLIQKTIREKFSRCTVLTVAHRLNTIMDSDKVLVMSFGKIVEFDHPHLLMKNKDGYLSRMADETGSQNKTVLADLAEASYNANKLNHEKDHMKMIDE